MTRTLALVLLVGWFCATECAHQAVVSFNARGITGTITFTEQENGVLIQTRLRGLRVAAAAHAGDEGHGGDEGGHGHGHGDSTGYLWHVHHLPVDQTVDPAVQCLNNWVGPHYDPFNARSYANYSMRCTQQTPELCEAGDLAGKFGTLMPHVNLNVTDTTGTLQLEGPYSIIGRSIVVHSNIDGSNFECGTIQLVEETQNRDEVALLQATFTYPLAGVIYFRQFGDEDTAIWGKLYWANNAVRTENHTWYITQTAPGEGHRTGSCDDVGNRYDAPGRTIPADPSMCANNATLCETGDLSGRLGFITVAATPGPQFYVDSFFFTDSTLNLANVRNRSVSIGQQSMGTTIVACAPLIDVETITLQQPVDGYLSVSQRGPYEDTVVTTNTLPSSSISLLDSAFNPLEYCPEGGSVFDPYEKTSLVGENTPDKYPLGDWQTRYGAQLVSNSVVRVFDLPVYGANTSISGLSVRYVRGTTRTCIAMIPMLRGDDVLLAKATFTGSANGNGDLNGAVYFVQRDFGYGQLGATHVFTDLQYASQRDPTSGHNWHVRQYSAQGTQGCGDILNPFRVSTTSSVGDSSSYNDDCSPQYPLRCQAGDLSGKHGQLDLYSDVSGRPTYTFVDPSLRLSGMFSIINQSVGVDGNSEVIGCARIRRMYISSRAVTLRTDRDTMLRTSVARRLVEGTSADFTDILVLREEVSYIGFGFECVNVTVRVLGSTTQEADSNANQVAENALSFECNHAISSVASLSALTLALCLLMVYLSLN